MKEKESEREKAKKKLGEKGREGGRRGESLIIFGAGVSRDRRWSNNSVLALQANKPSTVSHISLFPWQRRYSLLPCDLSFL